MTMESLASMSMWGAASTSPGLNSLVYHFPNVQYRLKGKTAIITGGDSGIGRTAAIMFAREGCTGLTITHLPEELEDATDAKASLEAAGAEVNLVSGDLEQTHHCKALVDSHLKRFGKLNILVNNASKQMYAVNIITNCSKLTFHSPACAKTLSLSTWRTWKALSAPTFYK